jgi:hypothetical protein
MQLAITDAARAKLAEAMAATSQERLVASVGWVSGGLRTQRGADGTEHSSPIQPHWGLGFYDPASLSPDQIIVVCGIPFLRDEQLDGKTLDFRDGHFEVK